MSDIQNNTETDASTYDTFILQLQPKYEEMLEVVVNCLPDTNENPTILDIGCGTGNLSLKIYQRFPNAKVICIDESLDYLKICQVKLNAFPNTEFLSGNFNDYSGENEKFDAIIMSFAFLEIARTDEEKITFLTKCKNLLKKDGVIYMAESIKPENNPYLESLYTQMAEAHRKLNCLDENDKRFKKYQKINSEFGCNLRKYVEVFNKAGFNNFNLVWKFYEAAVIGSSNN